MKNFNKCMGWGFFGLFSFAAVSSDAAIVKVFLLAGQSNADGRANGNSFPAALQSPVSNFDYYRFTEGASSGVLSSVVPNTSESGQTGPELAFAHSLRNTFPSEPIALIKYGNGGTDLASDWAAGGTSGTVGDGGDYQTFQTTVSDGLAALASANPANTYTIAGFLWVQGERDVVIGQTSAQYQSNLTTFITDVRQTYGDIPFLFSRLSDAQTGLSNSGNLSAIRAGQDAVDGAVDNTFLIDSDSFSLASDDVHFDASGQQALGEAFAQAAISSGAIPEPTTAFLSFLAGVFLMKRRR